MSELIKKQDAIMALKLEYPMMPMFKELREEWAIKTEGYRKAEEIIMSLPSAEPPNYAKEINIAFRNGFEEGVAITLCADRPQGYWIKTDVATYRCSECGKTQIADDENELNYCCCCGSKNKLRYLKGADDE